MKLSRNKIEKLLNGKNQSRKNFKTKAKAKSMANTNTMANANTNSYHHVMSDDDMVFMTGKHRRKAHSERIGKRPVNLRMKSLKRHRGGKEEQEGGKMTKGHPGKGSFKNSIKAEYSSMRYPSDITISILYKLLYDILYGDKFYLIRFNHVSGLIKVIKEELKDKPDFLKLVSENPPKEYGGEDKGEMVQPSYI